MKTRKEVLSNVIVILEHLVKDEGRAVKFTDLQRELRRKSPFSMAALISYKESALEFLNIDIPFQVCNVLGDGRQKAVTCKNSKSLLEKVREKVAELYPPEEEKWDRACSKQPIQEENTVDQDLILAITELLLCSQKQGLLIEDLVEELERLQSIRTVVSEIVLAVNRGEHLEFNHITGVVSIRQGCDNEAVDSLLRKYGFRLISVERKFKLFEDEDEDLEDEFLSNLVWSIFSPGLAKTDEIGGKLFIQIIPTPYQLKLMKALVAKTNVIFGFEDITDRFFLTRVEDRSEKIDFNNIIEEFNNELAVKSPGF